MTKQLDNKYLLSVSEKELSVLDEIISYAEKEIAEGSLGYRALKRDAYLKMYGQNAAESRICSGLILRHLN